MHLDIENREIYLLKYILLIQKQSQLLELMDDCEIMGMNP